MQLQHLLLTLVAISLLSACSSTPKDAPFDSELVFDSVPETSINALESAEDDYAKAERNQLGMFAPKHMQRAQQALQHAQQLETSTASEDDLAAHIAHMHTALEQAKRVRTSAEKTLSNVLVKHRALETLGTEYLLPKRYQAERLALLALLTSFEAGDTTQVQQSVPDTLQRLQVLERDVLLASAWQPASNALDKAVRENAQRYAPLSLKRAQRRVRDARIFINNNAHDHEACNRTGNQARQAALSALATTRESKRLSNLAPSAAEQYVRDTNRQLASVAKVLKDISLEGLSLEDQIIAIKQRIQERERMLMQGYEAKIKALSKERLKQN